MLLIKLKIYKCILNFTNIIKMSLPTIYTFYQPLIKSERNNNLNKTLNKILFYQIVIYIVDALNNFILLVLLLPEYFKIQII